MLIIYQNEFVYNYIKYKIYIDTKQSNKRNNQNSKDKTITWNKEIEMTEQHEPLWKPEVKSGALWLNYISVIIFCIK